MRRVADASLAQARRPLRAPPDLRNRDGDPLLLTVDHFVVAAGTMVAINARVAELDGAQRRACWRGHVGLRVPAA